jgi:hypothetical protein
MSASIEQLEAEVNGLKQQVSSLLSLRPREPGQPPRLQDEVAKIIGPQLTKLRQETAVKDAELEFLRNRLNVVEGNTNGQSPHWGQPFHPKQFSMQTYYITAQYLGTSETEINFSTGERKSRWITFNNATITWDTNKLSAYGVFLVWARVQVKFNTSGWNSGATQQDYWNTLFAPITLYWKDGSTVLPRTDIETIWFYRSGYGSNDVSGNLQFQMYVENIVSLAPGGDANAPHQIGYVLGVGSPNLKLYIENTWSPVSDNGPISLAQEIEIEGAQAGITRLHGFQPGEYET